MPALKIHKYNENKIHFLTFTVINWIDIFTKVEYFELLANVMLYCRENLGLKVYAYVFMTNHVHFIWQAGECYSLSKIVLAYKRHTTQKIEKLLLKDSRKYLYELIKQSKQKKKGTKFQVWQQYNYPEIVETEKFYRVKLNYIHNNPVKKRYVGRSEDWLY